MMSQKDPRFSKDDLSAWLSQLQRQSWELELLITGFSIFLLFKIPQALDLLSNKLLAASLRDDVYTIVFFLGFMKLAAAVIAVNLMVHVVLRGVWIGFVGLSSVFPDGIRYDRLNISERYRRILESRASSQTSLIIKLDQLASSIFSFSFLMACYIISVCLYFLGLTVLALFQNSTQANGQTAVSWTLLIIILFYVGLCAIPMIDFISSGAIRKSKFLDKILGPLFRIFEYLTLWFLYRPIYYILVSNYNRKLLHSIIFAYFIIIGLALSNTDNTRERYFHTTLNRHQMTASRFDNLRPKKEVITRISMEKDVVKDDHFKLFIRAHHEDEALLKKCRSLPELPNTYAFEILGFLRFDFSFLLQNEELKQDQLRAYFDTYLDCYAKLYEIHLNGERIDGLAFAFMRHPNLQEPGLVTMVPIPKTAKGKCTLVVKKKRLKGELEVFDQVVFWKM